jgi:hypothetical protein
LSTESMLDLKGAWGFSLDSCLRRSHPTVVKRLVASVTVGLIAFAAVALADAIQKWRTPDGSLYFGDRPPAGSTLVETYPDTPALPATVVSSDVADLSQAAADGRDIIRRREAAREAERQADAARETRMAEIEASQGDSYADEPFWFITSTIPPCRFGGPCTRDRVRDHRREGPRGGTLAGFVRERSLPATVLPFRPAPAPPHRSASGSFGMSTRLRGAN